MRINYQHLQLIDYEGAGNRTPVLNIGNIKGIELLEPSRVKKELENDTEFRIWLQGEGLSHKADSVMVYYKVDNADYDFVTFIGEPNSPLTNEFSEMCGNGIRSLALHILLTETNESKRHYYLQHGINVWAGSIRKLFIKDLDIDRGMGRILVNLGKIQSSLSSLANYLNTEYFSQKNLSTIKLSDIVPICIKDRHFGLGFNGDGFGEPHLVLVNNLNEYLDLIKFFSLSEELNRQTIISNLRTMVSRIGREITFKTNVFPLGINFNLALVLGENIFVSTHERNMSISSDECLNRIALDGVCNCNTLACGTGGSIVCVIAKAQRYINKNTFQTIHPGGDINYRIMNNESIMTGPAERISYVEDQVFPNSLFLETD